MPVGRAQPVSVLIPGFLNEALLLWSSRFDELTAEFPSDSWIAKGCFIISPAVCFSVLGWVDLITQHQAANKLVVSNSVLSVF